MTDGPKIKVNVSPKVAALARANVIGHISREVAAAADVPDHALATIYEGFRDGLMERVQIAQYTAAGERVGYLMIEVDWKQYAVNLTQGSHKSVFRLDPDSPVTGQVAPLLEIAAEFVAAKTKENGVKEVVTHFTAVSERKEEFRRRFHTSPVSDTAAERMREAALDHELIVTEEGTSELKVTYRYKDMKK
ncbi:MULTISPECIES: hypothetical protein [unclassified Micromonospora]|uniref:hypothetical protein n=1 Tax=unclassified Micromonospora TaxID=2617518 RepID=UPI00331F6CF7